MYIVKPLQAGEVVTLDHVRSVRPGFGLAPKYLEKIIGSTAKVDMSKGTVVKLDNFFITRCIGG